jgi:hypothetical protein
MVSFMQLWNNLCEEKDAEHIDTSSMKAIRFGLNIRDDFWDDFIQVCNNADSLAELLEVRPEQIAGWAGRIKHNLDKVQKADVSGGEEKKTKVLDTGDDFNTSGITI